MAKGQKRSHREPKKPKMDKSKPAEQVSSQVGRVFDRGVVNSKKR